MNRLNHNYEIFGKSKHDNCRCCKGIIFNRQSNSIYCKNCADYIAELMRTKLRYIIKKIQDRKIKSYDVMRVVSRVSELLEKK